MKTLYFDCSMGAAGDMLTAALLELIADQKGMIDQMNAIGIPNVKYVAHTATKCGINGTHVDVLINGEMETVEEHNHINEEHSHVTEHVHEEHSHDHGHEHSHEHSHEHHHHSSLSDIEHIVRHHMTLPQKVADDVMAVYTIIAQAESRAHGLPVADIHFHEVGTMDAIADITAVCLLMYILSPQKVVVSPICVGSGQVKCAHGVLPVPAPATAHILKNVPIYSGSIQSEMCTPTGAALLKYFATDYGTMPAMTVEAVGYGMGKKDFEAANCVRVMMGEAVEGMNAPTAFGGDTDSSADGTVIELSCNLDDMTSEKIGFAIERLLEEGALEAYAVPVIMKKSRPGHVLCVLVKSEDVDKMVRMIFKHTTTIGIRKQIFSRYTLEREERTIRTNLGDIRQKISRGYGVERRKYEYDDVAHIAKLSNKSYDEVVDIISKIEV